MRIDDLPGELILWILIASEVLVFAAGLSAMVAMGLRDPQGFAAAQGHLDGRLAALNTVTSLSAETVGRAYGGGMLKIEPKEADRLPVPTPAVLAAARDQLTAVRPQVSAKLRTPRGLLDAVKLIDDVLLVGQLGMRRGEVRALREAHAELSARRVARGKAAR